MVHAHPSTPAERLQWVSQMLAHQGEYGLVSNLSRLHQVSRQTLYTWTAQARQALEQVFVPARPTTRPIQAYERAILTLLLDDHATVRGIATSLPRLGYGTLSLGTIQAIISAAERRALSWMQTHMPATPRALALDEIYRAQRDAYLNIVDTSSWAVWASAGPLSVDGDSWTLLLWEAQDAGLRFSTFVSDGERAITQACALVAPATPHQRDVWHVLHRCAQVQGRLDRLVARLQEQQATVERQIARMARGERPRGRTPHTDRAAHAAKLEHASRSAEELRYLSGELRALLEVIVLERGQLLDSPRRQANLLALLELIGEVMSSAPEGVREELRRLYRYLELAQGALLTFTATLDRVHQDAGVILGASGVALVGWAWMRRSILGPQDDELLAGLPVEWRAAARLLLKAWGQAVRASSAVENWHSILRPHLAVHRKLSNGRLALLAVWHNHRVFPEGTHAGHSPLQLSGMRDAPTDWLEALGYPPVQTSVTSPVMLPEPIVLALAA
jgi:transposase-like protein